jgi:hypothetical protein
MPLPWAFPENKLIRSKDQITLIPNWKSLRIGQKITSAFGIGFLTIRQPQSKGRFNHITFGL